jgi:ATP-dependent Clp protease ATP-binding subunit ClpA
MQQIVKQKVKTEITRLQEKGYKLSYDANILPFLMNAGVNSEFGARPVVQTIQKYIALAIINKNKTVGNLTVNNNKLIL